MFILCRFNRAFAPMKSDLLNERNISTLKELAEASERVKFPRSVLFFGSDDFSLDSLCGLQSMLFKGEYVNNIHVVTTSNSSKNPVVAHCKKFDLPMQCWPVKLDDLPKCNIGVVVSFGHMIPSKIIQAFPLGVLNVHGSLLPAYRGAAPIVRSVFNNDRITGVTVMRIHPHKFDVGEILRQASVAISEHTSSVVLRAALGQLGARLLVTVLSNLGEHYEMGVPQPATGISYAPKVKDCEAQIYWSVFDANTIYRKALSLDTYLPIFGKFKERQPLILRSAVYRSNYAKENLDVSDLGVKFVNEDYNLINKMTDEYSVKNQGGELCFGHCLKKQSQLSQFDGDLIRKDCAVDRCSRIYVDPYIDEGVDLRLKSLNKYFSDAPIGQLVPGQIEYKKHGDVIWVGCDKKSVIGFLQVKPKDKKIMSAKDFYNGILSKIKKEDWQFFCL